ncbi:MAG: hypothetical protein H7X71_06220, partial [Chitinophagales bacterium]|nr:hypothetical protein [Chitinophagales bacterium]
DTLAEEVTEVSSFQSSGLHRTETELADKDAIHETIGGIDISYFREQLTIGIAAVYFGYDTELNKDISPYEMYDFEGDQLLNASLHYSYLFRNILFFGETAMSDNKKVGTLNGIIMPIDKTVDLTVSYRYYDPAYQTLYALAFSENSLPQNEEAIYMGLEIKPVRTWKISGYIDLYKNPWLEFDADAPAYGTDLLGEVNFKPNKIFETYLRFKNEVSDNNLSSVYTEDEEHDIIGNREKGYIRWHMIYKINSAIILKSRVEHSYYEEQTGIPEKGYLVYQDVHYDPLNFPLSFSTRITFFNTDSYNTRIYTYENDVLYAYSIVALSGRGMRSYLTLAYSPFKWMDMWFRIGQTWYDDNDEVIGSGLDAITGNTKSDAKLQIRLKW